MRSEYSYETNVEIHANGVLVAAVHNEATDVGRNTLAKLLAGPGVVDGRDSIFSPKAIAIGTGTTPETAGDTELVAEVFRKRIIRRAVSGKEATFQVLFLDTEATDDLITEALLVNSESSGGESFARATFGSINWTAAPPVELTITWKLKVN
jgi:hypothetical protein